MATQETLISLPSINAKGSLSPAAVDTDFTDPLNRRYTHNPGIERYLRSTEDYLPEQVLQWDSDNVEECMDTFGKDGGERSSHRTGTASQRNGVRSKTEPMYVSFPATRETHSVRPRTWTGGTQPETLYNTWPRGSIEMKEEHFDRLGKLHRENLDYITRQTKHAHKLSYDNMAARETLRKAQAVIEELRAKISRRNKYIRDRREKEGDLVDMVENLRRARDEKLQEYKSLVKSMNEALKEKEELLEHMAMEQAKAEVLYQRQLTENTELLRKIETREKAIKTLREKTGKVKKWKDEARS